MTEFSPIVVLVRVLSRMDCPPLSRLVASCLCFDLTECGPSGVRPCLRSLAPPLSQLNTTGGGVSIRLTVDGLLYLGCVTTGNWLKQGPANISTPQPPQPLSQSPSKSAYIDIEPKRLPISPFIVFNTEMVLNVSCEGTGLELEQSNAYRLRSKYFLQLDYNQKINPEIL